MIPPFGTVFKRPKDDKYRVMSLGIDAEPDVIRDPNEVWFRAIWLSYNDDDQPPTLANCLLEWWEPVDD